MREITSLSLPRSFLQRLIRVSRKKGLTKSEMMRIALRDYLIREEFQEIRRRVLLESERSGGPYSDQDIFERVS